jgi:hypothetical protein
MTELLLLCSNLLIAQVPDWEWARRTGSNYDDFSSGIITDETGNIYMTGRTDSVITTGYFIAKYDSSGVIQWMKGDTISPHVSGGNSITIDAAGYIYVIGRFEDSISFNNNILVCDNNYGMFITKYNSSGNVIWTKCICGNIYGIITSDDLCNIYLSGSFGNYNSPNYSIVFDTIVLTSYGNQNVYVAKLDSSGNVLWAKSAGGINDDVGCSITMGTSYNVYVTGYFKSPSIYFGSDTLTNSNPMSSNFFIVKLDSAGNIIWAKNVSGTSNSYSIGCDIYSDNDGEIIVTGYFHDTINFNNSTFTALNNNIFIAKYNTAGNLIWVKRIGNNDNKIGVQCSITADINCNVYVIGTFLDSLLIIGNSILTMMSNSSKDMFIAKYDSLGNPLWAKNTGDLGIGCGSDIKVDIFDNVLITGYFSGISIIFGSDTLTNISYPGWDYSDIFLAKLSNSITSINETKQKNSITVYPNPSNSNFMISGLPASGQWPMRQ